MKVLHKPPDFIVRSALPGDYVEAGELVASIFSHGDVRFYERFLHHWVAARPHEPGFDYRLLRLGFKDGKPVTHVRVKLCTLHYGAARLHIGGVSEVCTHPDHRNQGYSGI